MPCFALCRGAARWCEICGFGTEERPADPACPATWKKSSLRMFADEDTCKVPAHFQAFVTCPRVSAERRVRQPALGQPYASLPNSRALSALAHSPLTTLKKHPLSQVAQGAAPARSSIPVSRSLGKTSELACCFGSKQL